MAKARRTQPRKAKEARTSPAPHPELKAASRAQLGPDVEQRPYRPKDDDASVQDPLRDWPEDD